jgi:hypothetical protein
MAVNQHTVLHLLARLLHRRLALVAHLEALVLEDLLDRNILELTGSTEELGLEDDTEGAVTDHLAVRVRELLRFARLAIRSDDLDDLVGVVKRCGTQACMSNVSV